MATLQFNDTTDLQGVIQACEDNCQLEDGGISGDDAELKKFTRYANDAMSKIWMWIFFVHGGWKYDDKNKSDLPSASQDLTSGTASYALPTEALTVEAIEIKDPNGKFIKLTPTTDEEIRRTGSVGSFMDSQEGVPQYYTLTGSTVKIFPTPNYTQAVGFKVFFDRASVAFDWEDTDLTPGFESEFHDAVPTWASIKWLKINKPNSNTLVALMGDWTQFEKDIKKFYSSRFKALPIPSFGQRITEFH